MTGRIYIYLSAHVSVWLRLYVFASLALVVVFYGFKVPLPLWSSPIVSAVPLMLIFLFNLGLIVKRTSGTPTDFVIRDLKNTIVLKAPLEFEGWWHYIHRGISKANDINVVLRVTDADGKTVYFTETIMFETRHPNEVPFRDELVPETATPVIVQRTDKLIRFLDTEDSAD